MLRENNTTMKEKVLMPKSVSDALVALRKIPNSIIFAGGSNMQTWRTLPSHYVIVALSNIEELKRIYQDNTMLEIGSMVTFEKIWSLQRIGIPQGLIDIILSIPFSHIRSVATIGGNIFAHSQYISIDSYLSLIGANIELRRSGGSRNIHLSDVTIPLRKQIADGEILTSIRFPLIWNHQMFRLFYSYTTQQYYAFCALATEHNGILEGFKIAYFFANTENFYNHYAESLIIGQKTPLRNRNIQQFLQEFESAWRKSITWSYTDVFMRTQLKNLSAWFIHKIRRN